MTFFFRIHVALTEYASEHRQRERCGDDCRAEAFRPSGRGEKPPEPMPIQANQSTERHHESDGLGGWGNDGFFSGRIDNAEFDPFASRCSTCSIAWPSPAGHQFVHSSLLKPPVVAIEAGTRHPRTSAPFPRQSVTCDARSAAPLCAPLGRGSGRRTRLDELSAEPALVDHGSRFFSACRRRAACFRPQTRGFGLGPDEPVLAGAFPLLA